MLFPGDWLLHHDDHIDHVTFQIEELPKKVDSITPYTMALIAKYIARHRLRETRLLDTIADFLVKKAEYLDSKVRTGQDGRSQGLHCLCTGLCRCVCTCVLR